MKLKSFALVTIFTLSVGACSTQEPNDTTDQATSALDLITQPTLSPAVPDEVNIEEASHAVSTLSTDRLEKDSIRPDLQSGAHSKTKDSLHNPVNGNKQDTTITHQPIDARKMAMNQPMEKPKLAYKREATSKLNAMTMDRSAFANRAAPSSTNPSVSLENIRYSTTALDRENYDHFNNSPVTKVSEQPVSTFSIDVDTGSYTNVRRILREGRLPAKDAVRAEEFVNYFSYNYPSSETNQRPFTVTTELGQTPWNPATKLLHIGIKGYDVSRENLPPSNLVFLLDVSGSMHSADKLPLLKNGLTLLTNTLRPQDRVAIVVYAGASGIVLPSTAGNNKYQILTALEQLSAGGSTNGASGIHLAYQVARQAFIPGGINRVILATDGDFNVGTVDFNALKNLIEEKRQTGISLTTLGFGTGNYNDKLMEQLADAGNGNYAYIDTLLEAQKCLIDEIGSTLMTIAKDVKIQIEFNPAVVTEYRLIGYENRALKREDFNNDKIDAGEIGAGHTVTALYEIALTGEGGQKIDPLRYQPETNKPVNVQKHEQTGGQNGELAFLKIRYKKPSEEKSLLISQRIGRDADMNETNKTTDGFRFSASVVAFAQLLRGGQQLDKFNFDDVLKLAQQSKGADQNGYRGEFINLVKLAKSITGPTNTAAID